MSLGWTVDAFQFLAFFGIAYSLAHYAVRRRPLSLAFMASFLLSFVIISNLTPLLRLIGATPVHYINPNNPPGAVFHAILVLGPTGYYLWEAFDRISTRLAAAGRRRRRRP